MTEYRIITLRTFIGDRYLQFKSTEPRRAFPRIWDVRQAECWRFVPNNEQCTLGFWKEEDCPTSLPFGCESRYLSGFVDQDGIDLIPFTKRYPDIALYFAELQAGYREHRAKEERASSSRTTYLRKTTG